MPQRFRTILLSLLALSFLLNACSKKFSTDTTLPTSYYPSVIINSDNQVIYALDPVTGKKNWEYGLPVLTSRLAPTYFAPSPLLYNEMVYMASYNSDTIYKIDAKTGALVKKITIPNEVFRVEGTPIADANLIYIVGTNGRVYAFDTGTYALKWRFITGSAGDAIYSSPTLYGTNLYVATFQGYIYCIDKTNGTTTVGSPNLPTWSWNRTGASPSFVSSPAVYPPFLYVGSISDDSLYCFFLMPPATTPATPTVGRENWAYHAGGRIYSSPAATAQRVVFGADDFNVYCLDTDYHALKLIGRPQEIWHDSTHSPIWASPVVHSNIVYITGYDYNLYAIRMVDGIANWVFQTKGLIKSSPLVYNGTVYFGSYDKYLYAVDTALGTLKWTKNVNGEVECSPVIDDLTGASYNSQISGYTNY